MTRHGYILLLPTSSLRAAMQSASVSPQLHPPLRWSEWGSDALLLYQHEVDSEGESWIYPSKDRRPYGSRMPVLIYPDGFDTAVGKIEAHIGEGFTLPKDFSVAEARRRSGLPATNVSATDRQARLAAFWDAVKERASWKKVYADGLH